MKNDSEQTDLKHRRADPAWTELNDISRLEVLQYKTMERKVVALVNRMCAVNALSQKWATLVDSCCVEVTK